VLEELAYSRAQAGTRPDVAEPAPEVAEVMNENRSIEGTAKRTANESSRGFGGRVDRLTHRREFCDRNPTVKRI